MFPDTLVGTGCYRLSSICVLNRRQLQGHFAMGIMLETTQYFKYYKCHVLSTSGKYIGKCHRERLILYNLSAEFKSCDSIAESLWLSLHIVTRHNGPLLVQSLILTPYTCYLFINYPFSHHKLSLFSYKSLLAATSVWQSAALSCWCHYRLQ